MEAPEVRPATDADARAMAGSLALAFADDPMMRWLFGDDEGRLVRALRRFFTHEARRHLAHGAVYTTDDHSGAAYWDDPGRWRTRPREMLRVAPFMARRLGPRLPRAMRAISIIERAHARHPEHHYLAILGTRPDRQGQGIGGALMAPVLERCDRDGIGAYLESSKESNIAYYRRFGFEVVEELAMPRGPSLWPMWRDPAS